MTKERRAILLESNIEIEVYKSSLRKTWINSRDCTTEYTEKQLKFI